MNFIFSLIKRKFLLRAIEYDIFIISEKELNSVPIVKTIKKIKLQCKWKFIDINVFEINITYKKYIEDEKIKILKFF